MSLPLPRVVADVGPGGGLVTALRGMNALANDYYQNEIAQSQAQYSPYTNYANALSKIAYAASMPAQIAGAPLQQPLYLALMKDNPQLMNATVGNYQKAVGNMQNMLNGMSIPAPNQMSQGKGGILNALQNWWYGENQNQPAQQPAPQMIPPGAQVQNDVMDTSGNPNTQIPIGRQQTQNTGDYNSLIPGTQGTIQGYVGQKTAPFVEQVHKPGTTYYDPETGSINSTPTGDTVSNVQQSMNATARTLPMIKRLAEQAGPFLSAAGQGKLAWEQVANFFNPNYKGKLPTQYAEFQASLAKIPESLLKAYGLRATDHTINEMKKIIQPVRGETENDYYNRMVRQMDELRNEQIKIPAQNLARGFNIDSNASNQKPVESGSPVSPDKQFDAWFNNQQAKWNNLADFQKWYKQQTPRVQALVKAKLGGK